MSTAARLRTFTVASLAGAAAGGVAVFALDLFVLGAFVIEALASAVLILAMTALAAVRKPWTPAAAGVVVALLIGGSLTSPWVSGRLLHPAGQWEFFVPTLIGVVCGVLAAATGTAATAAALRDRRPSAVGK